MPRLSGRLAPVLSVTDPAASAEWYAAVFGFDARREFAGPDGRMLDVCMRHPETGMELCLASRRVDPFERGGGARSGLDHLEFIVEDRADLDAWVARLDELGVAHSGVKVAPASKNSMVTFRDPDNIQLELFWPAADLVASNGHAHRATAPAG